MTASDATNIETHPRNDTNSSSPLLKMTIVGVAVAIALGWTLLSFAISLPFFLGVFFFMLFGLFVGAAMFRTVLSVKPITKKTVVTATIITVLVGWTTAIVKEGVDYPKDFVKQAHKKAHVPPTEGAHDRVQAELRAFIVGHLDQNYPPGGVLGYLQLAATGQTVTIENLPTQQPRAIVIKPRASALTWWIRNLICMVMYYVAIFSITSDLIAKPQDASQLPEAGTSESDDLDISSSRNGSESSQRLATHSL